MENLTKEMQEVLSKHLPAMQAEEFRKFIEDSREQKEQLKATSEKLKHKEKELEKMLDLKANFERANGIKAEGENALKIAQEKAFAPVISDDQLEEMVNAIDQLTVSHGHY